MTTKVLKPLPVQPPITKENSNAYFSSLKAAQTYRDPYVSGRTLRFVAWNYAGNRLAVIQQDRSMRIWTYDKPDVKSSIEIRNAHQRVVESICWSPLYADELVSCSTDGKIKLWDTRTKSCLREVNTEEQGNIMQNLSVKYSADGAFISVIQREDRVLILNKYLVPVCVFHEPTDEIFDVSWSNSSQVFAVSLGNGNVRICRIIDSGDDNGTEVKIIHTLRGHRTAANCISFDPRGKYLAVGSNEGIVSVWDLQDWISVKTFTKIDQSVTSISFSHDSAYLAIACDANVAIDIVHVDSGEYVYTHQRSNHVSRPVVTWHPLRYSLAYTGDPYGLAILGGGRY